MVMVLGSDILLGTDWSAEWNSLQRQFGLTSTTQRNPSNILEFGNWLVNAGSTVANSYFNMKTAQAQSQSQVAELERQRSMTAAGINPFSGTTLKDATPYLVAGGALLIGVVVILATQRARRRRRG